jgi:hypothetical protein
VQKFLWETRIALLRLQNVSLLLVAFQLLQDHLQASLELPFGAGLAFALGVFRVILDGAAVKISSLG